MAAHSLIAAFVGQVATAAEREGGESVSAGHTVSCQTRGWEW